MYEFFLMFYYEFFVIVFILTSSHNIRIIFLIKNLQAVQKVNLHHHH